MSQLYSVCDLGVEIAANLDNIDDALARVSAALKPMNAFLADPELRSAIAAAVATTSLGLRRTRSTSPATER